MKRRIFILVLVAALVLALCGCGGTAGEIANSVMNAAMKELQNQVTQLLERNKLEVVEVKTAVGQINEDGGKYYSTVCNGNMREYEAVLNRLGIIPFNKLCTVLKESFLV